MNIDIGEMVIEPFSSSVLENIRDEEWLNKLDRMEKHKILVLHMLTELDREELKTITVNELAMMMKTYAPHLEIGLQKIILKFVLVVDND